ncbi:hypothetical protein F5148DRAFT_1163185 [Russula earlei]|uniref:Uncharacterized protein n=1 Tax=Russula earlei TaxID=71964 RepID=A0ACC0UL17_9AGAM|nr:hypothetical protein F5148DRAFT_1163185 [Russula earlei]
MSTPVCTTISANPDVVGKGIRINFYFTMILLAIIPRTPNTKELLDTLYATAGFAGLGLLLTAIIQTASKQLTLFEALFVLHILFFLGTGAAPMGKYHWSKGRIAIGIFIQFASVIAFTTWGLYLWFNVKHYGQHPECNDQIKYVIMFKTVRATVPWLRGVWIALIIASAVGLIIEFGHSAVHLFVMKSEEERERTEMDPTARTPDVTGTAGVEPQEGTESPTSEGWYFETTALLFFLAIYCTVMLELTVHRNAAHVQNGKNVASGVIIIDESWAFGQVLSVVMIVENVNELAHFLFGFLARRRRGLAGERQAQADEGAHVAEQHNSTASYRLRGPPSGSSASPSTPDPPPVKTTSDYELYHVDKGNFQVSETVVDTNTHSRKETIGPLR